MYVGGRFALGEGRAQRSLATLDLASGAADGLGADGQLGRLGDRSGRRRRDRLLGGAFTTVDGKARRRLAALRAADGSLLPWNVGCERGRPRARRWNGEELWVGGQFTSIGGEQRRGVASVEIATARRRRVGMPAANGNVESLAVIGETVYVAGPFTAIGGRSRKHLARTGCGDGAATRWDPAPDDVVRALAVAPDGAQLVVAGDFERVGGGTTRRRVVRTREAAIVTDWRPVAPFSGLALAFGEAGMVFVGGEGALAVFRWPPLL